MKVREESGLGKRMKFTLVDVTEDGLGERWIVYSEMIFQESLQIRRSVLGCPEHVFAMNTGFGLGDKENCLLEVVAVSGLEIAQVNNQY